MESAKEFLERVSKVKRGYRWDMDTIIDLQEARDAAIRKECADRAVEWARWANIPRYMQDSLQSVIEGRP